jgi:hypothetical protein
MPVLDADMRFASVASVDNRTAFASFSVAHVELRIAAFDRRTGVGLTEANKSLAHSRRWRRLCIFPAPREDLEKHDAPPTHT